MSDEISTIARRGKSWAVFTTTEKILMGLGSLACIVATRGLSSMLDVPRESGFGGSLLAGHSPVVSIITAAIAIAICMVIGSLMVAFVEEEGGLFCTSIGLCALAVRCGSIRPVLQLAAGPGVLVTMAFEILILGAILIAGWWTLSRLFVNMRAAQVPAMAAGAPNEIVDATLAQKLMTLATQVVVTAVVEQILIQADAKAQAMAGVCVAAFTGSMAAYMITPLSEGLWYWTGPILVGAIGYVMAYFTADGLGTGELHGWAAALARPVPLDYAGIGTAGALVGYWASRRWAQPEPDEGDDDEDVEAPAPSNV